MTTRIVRWTTAVAAAAALAGCAETGPGEDAYGSLATAITATGSDGASYRMPAGTFVQVWNGTFSDFWSMDGDFQILTIDVPVGDYQVALSHGSGYTLEWPLERTNPDATTETVTATLLTVQPVPVTVNEGATSSLVFQFQVVDGGTVTFAHGLIDISIDVEVDTSAEGRATFSATYNHDSADFGATAPATLGDFLPAVGDPVFHQMSVNVVGDWVQTSANSACSTATLIGGTVSASYVELAREAWTGGATARLCVYGGTYAPYVFVESYRSGPPVTATFAALADEVYAYQTMNTFLPDPIFDGTNLDLGAMTGTFTVSGGMYSYLYGVPSGGGSFDYWYSDFNSSSSLTFTYLPTL